MEGILKHCHKTAAKVLQSGVFKDSLKFISACDQCRMTENLSKRHEMPLNNMLVIELFHIWGIYFMGTLPTVNSNKFILVAIDYFSKWVEAE